MSDKKQNLGKLVAVHGPAPAFLQRSAFVVVLSFLFFLITMAVNYLRPGTIYFFLATAFLVIYVISLISLLSQRKNTVKIYEHGFEFKKESVVWNEVAAVGEDGVIRLTGEKTITIPGSLRDISGLISRLKAGAPGPSSPLVVLF